MDCPVRAAEHDAFPSNDDCSPEQSQIKPSSSSPHGPGEPGPAVATDSADLDPRTGELEYFRSLPEQDLEELYPHGIRPPANLGPLTPYDRYDQFHQALLHLAAGVSLHDVMRIGDFDIDGNQFVTHMAVFCVKSLGYTDLGLSRLGIQLLGRGCADADAEEGGNLSQSSSTEGISILPRNNENKEQEDTVEETTYRQRQGRGVEQGDTMEAIAESVTPGGTVSPENDPPNERVEKHNMSSFRMCGLRVDLSTCFWFLLIACLKYAVAILIVWFLDHLVSI
jgi:hypothetical protein